MFEPREVAGRDMLAIYGEVCLLLTLAEARNKELEAKLAESERLTAELAKAQRKEGE